MNLQDAINWLDQYQQSHKVSALIFGVIRKHTNDQGGYLSALITYYGFLSLFPLLLAITSILKIALVFHLPLASNLSLAVTNLFPLIGNDLHNNVHGLKGTGLSLLLSLILTLYGARGVADAIRYAIDEIWKVPHSARLRFPDDLIKSFQIIILGGGGFLASSLLEGLAQSASHALWLVILVNIVSFAIIYATLLGVFVIATPKDIRTVDIRRGAVVMALSMQLLQVFGAILLARELHSLSAAYGAFALVLGLVFYISLQAQILIYALEYNVVVRNKLWPRSLVQVSTSIEGSKR